jgi:PAS domain S-box-containing protein
MPQDQADRPSAFQALERLQAALKAAGIVVWDLDLLTGRTDRSHSSIDVLGIASGSGADFARLVHPADRARVDAAMASAHDGEHTYDIEFRVVRPDGETRWVREAATLHRDAAGQPRRLTGVSVDITERKRGEQALERERELLQGIIDGIPVLITLYEPDTRLLRLNREFTRVTGWTTEDTRDGDLMSLCYPDAGEREAARAFMQSVAPGWRDFRITGKDGAAIDTSWANIRLSDGRQVGIGIDLRERREAEAALRESEERYRQVVEISLEAIWVHCDGRIVFANAQAARAFGLNSAADLIGRPVLDFTHPDDRERALERTRRMLERHEHAPLTEMRFIAANGSTIALEVRAIPFLYDGRPAILAVGRDMTERKAAAERQALLMAELDHRVRNILASVQAMVSLTSRSATSVQDYAAVLQGRIAAMAQAHGLLTRRRWQGADLMDVVRAALQAYPEAVIIRGEPGCVLRAKDAINLALVLHELATNAAKYGALSTAGGRIAVEWQVQGSGEAARARFVWSESGGPPVYVPTRRGFGSQLIENALGNAVLEFAPSGLRCEILLKLRSEGSDAKPVGAAAPAAAPAAAAEPGPLRGMRVLIVEDEPLAALDLRAALEEAGAQIAGMASTLKEAMAQAEKDVSVAVLDVNLDGEMVYPAAERLAARGIPVILTTGYDTSTVVPERLAGMPAFQKPVDYLRLVQRLAALTKPLP